MGAPFHDAAQLPGGRSVGFRAGPRGPGSGTVSLEGGAPENRVANTDVIAADRSDQPVFAPKATARSRIAQRAPAQAPLGTQKGRSPTRSDRPFFLP
ncbi:hypothetical protein GCM10010344_25020 [Streptomyces bluensis]|nr:hypothetical protein GCM10010344_25020 [Streptomyces bluensis]